MSPASRAFAGAGALRPRRPGLTFLPLLADRRSPRTRTLPPPVDDELVRQECDGTGAAAQERVRETLIRGRDGQRQHDEVVAVDDLVGQPVGEVGRSGGPATAAQRGRGVSDQALRERHARRRRRSRPRRRRRTSPSTSRTPAGSSERSSRARAPGGRRRRRRPGPPRPRANAIQSLRLESRSARGGTTVPTARPAIASVTTSGASAAAITARTPDHAAIFAAASLVAMPPLPRSVPRAAGERLERGVDLDDLLDERRARRRAAGSAVNSPAVSVSSTSRSAPTRCDDERGEAVVVAVADLVVGDGVVLVDDRHDAEVEQPAQRLAGVQVLRRDAEVVRREQHLAGDEAVRRPRIAPSRSISRGWPTAATACSVPMSVGRVGEARARAGRRRSRPSTRARPRGRRRAPRRARAHSFAQRGVVELARVAT